MIQKNPQNQVYTPGMAIMYFVLVFTITWGILFPTFAFVPESSQIFFIILAAFSPFLSAIIVLWTKKGKAALAAWLREIFRLRIPEILYLTGAFFLPLGVGYLHYSFYRLLGGTAGFSEAIPWYLYLIYLIPTALLTGGNEEPGWRGFALPALLQWFNPVVTSLILGVIHSLWHLPLMGYYNTTIGWYLFNVVPLTFIFNWLYLVSRKSVIPVMLFHAGTNVIGSFIPTPMNVLGGTDSYMVIRGAVYWIFTIVILILTKGQLGWKKGSYDVQT